MERIFSRSERRISIHALREEGDGEVENKPWMPENFYPRPPRGGRRQKRKSRQILQSISIHALREEGDVITPLTHTTDRIISIHALREEGDSARSTESSSASIFLSTPSARRATVERGRRWAMKAYFYPRPPRGGRRVSRCRCLVFPVISIHALREEGDTRRWTMTSHRKIFLSTPSARRATHLQERPRQLRLDFYPRPPRGGRPSPRHPTGHPA